MTVWRACPDLPEYLCSSEGLVMRERHLTKGRMYGGKPWAGRLQKMAGSITRRTIYYKGKNYKVARLVCAAFHGPAPPGKPVCLHIDEDSENNRPDNLKWGTQKENLNARWFLDYCRGRTGQDNPLIKGRNK